MTFEIVPADVISHAGSVEGFAADLRAAGGRGASVDLGVETYGLIGQAFSVGVRKDMADVAENFAEVAAALTDIADALRDSADVVRETDDEHRKQFDKFLGGR